MRAYEVSSSTGTNRHAVYSILVGEGSPSSGRDVSRTPSRRSSLGTCRVGDLRIARSGRRWRSERIVRMVPDRVLGFEVDGSAVRDHYVEVALYDRPDGGTDIRWSGSFEAVVPGFAWMLARHFRKLSQSAVENLAQRAEASGAPDRSTVLGQAVDAIRSRRLT